MPVSAELERPSAGWRIYYVHVPLVASSGGIDVHLARAAKLGFDTVLVSPVFQPAENGDVFLTSDHGRVHAAFGGGDASDCSCSWTCRSGASLRAIRW